MKKRSALLLATLLAFVGTGLARAAPPAAECPQPRFTGKAPDDYYNRTNPLGAAADSAAGRRLFIGGGGTLSCAACHGEKGDGRGDLSDQFKPRPRNWQTSAREALSRLATMS